MCNRLYTGNINAGSAFDGACSRMEGSLTGQ